MFYNNLCKHIGKKNKLIIIFDGPPASGKSTIATFLKHSFNAKIYCYKRLGFVNIVAKLLIGIAPHLRVCRFADEHFVDSVMIIDSNLLKKISFLTFYLEIAYKFLQYCLLFMHILTESNVVVDEGPSLGWANYLSLMLSKKVLKPYHVDLLMRLDLQLLRALSRLRRIHMYFIDRSQEKLSILWHRKGSKSPYGIMYASLVRYSFRLFEGTCRRRGINIRVRYVYFP
jgi:hypothetical protein